jgi:hypothetical protein
MAATEPKPPEAPKRKRKARLRWTPTPHVKAGLLRIQSLGILGHDLSQIVNHLVGEELRRLMQAGLLKRDELDQEVAHLPQDQKEPPPKFEED